MHALDTLTIQLKDVQSAREKAERAVADMRLKVAAMARTVQQLRDTPCPVRSALENLIPAEPMASVFAAPVTKNIRPQRIVEGCALCGGTGRLADDRCLACGGEG